MRKAAILVVMALFCALPIPTQASGLDSAETSSLAYCSTASQVQCIESLEYLSKDSANGQYESFVYQAPIGGNTAAANFATNGTSFQTTDGSTNLLLNALVIISKVADARGWMVPGYLGNTNNLNTTLVPITEKYSARSLITISNDQGGTSVQGYGQLRLGDKFRLIFRSGDLNPTSFETRTRKFDFSVAQKSGYFLISEEGEVGEYLMNEAGAFSQTCYSSTSKAWGAAGYWMTEAYSAKPEAGHVLAPYKATMQTDCPVVLPSYALNGQTQFSLSAPHFRPDGITPINGYMEIQMPLSFWPNLAKEESNQVSVSYGGEFTPVAATRSVSNSEVKYVIEDFHFSAPTFAIGAEYFTTGNKGKTLKVSRVLSDVKFARNSKSKLSYASLSKKNCKVSGSKIKLLSRGTCTLQIKVKNPKPAAEVVSGTIDLSSKKTSLAQIASMLNAETPTGSSLSISIAKSSKSVCTTKSGKVVKKKGGACSVTLKIQAPAPPTSIETIKISIK
jgi:hypothetical protein